MTTSPIAEENLPPPHEERLSIGLLMLWTALTAMLLGFHRATSQPTNGELGLLPALLSYITSPLIAVGLSAWVLMLWRWFHDGPRFPSQPGHWLLLLFGFNGVSSLLLRAAVLISLARLGGTNVFIGIYWLTAALALAMYLFALAATADRWRILFGVGAASSLLGLLMSSLLSLDIRLMQWLTLAQQVLGWIFGLCLVALAVADLRQGVRRDTLHWTGVLVVGGYLIYTIALPILIYFAR